MDSVYWLKLKSGSDIRGVAIETEGSKVTLTDEAAYEIASAFLYWLSARVGRDKLAVAVGHDSRLSAERIHAAVLRAAVDAGAVVHDCGLCSTPSMFMMTQYPGINADGAIMITASHHPYDKNGLKFFTAQGGAESGDITKILETAAAGRRLTAEGGEVIVKDYLKLYCDRLTEYFCRSVGEIYPLKGFRIVVDAGNGAGGFFAKRVLKALGANTAGSQFLEPDGSFPNHIPNPENAVAMRSISECTTANRADLGIIFDTDVDRAACVGPDGAEINRNRLIALISAIILKNDPGATIVTDSATSDGLAEFIREHNGCHHRYKRGYRNVINEAVELNKMGVDTPLAIETSGHAAFRENFFLDDGAYLVIKLLIEMCRARKEDKRLLDLISGLKEPAEEAEIRVGFKTEHWQEYGAEVLEKLKYLCLRRKMNVDPKSYEGVRVSLSNGFFLIRQSVHDPLLPINIESTEKGGVKKLAKALKTLLSGYKDLDLTPLIRLCKK
ncbi:MAG: phosphomannomutase/phosphoglucomutase [Clostridiales bacterium]|jgi:phosphomannomutase|nr:phosphomannomutase/phosphoglucomutase [Clostridiales bacterium]